MQPRDALEQQRREIETRLSANRTPFEDIPLTASSPYLPQGALLGFLAECAAQELGLSTPYASAMLEEGLSGGLLGPAPKSWPDRSLRWYNALRRWLGSVGRRSDEQGLYRERTHALRAYLAREHAPQIETQYARTRRFLLNSPPIVQLEVGLTGRAVEFAPYDHQRSEAGRLLRSGEGMCAFDTGVGKTLVGILTTLLFVEKRGVRRPLILVPGGSLAKWAGDFAAAFPGRPLHLVGLRRDADGSYVDTPGAAPVWAAIGGMRTLAPGVPTLIGFDAFERLEIGDGLKLGLLEDLYFKGGGVPPHLKPETLGHQDFAEYTRLKVAALLACGELDAEALSSAEVLLTVLEGEVRSLEEAVKSDPRDESLKSARARKRERRAYYKWLSFGARALSSRAEAPPLLWEDLGVDFVCVDEAHHFKALFPGGKQARVKYLGASDRTSQRATDLYFKLKEMQRRTGGAGTVLLDATPLDNSPLDLYNLLSLLHDHPLSAVGVDSIESYLQRYGDLEEAPAYDLHGELVSQKTFKGFRNLRELRSLLEKRVRYLSHERAGLSVPRVVPEFRMLPPSAEQDAVLDRIVGDPAWAAGAFLGVALPPAGTPQYAQLAQRYHLASLHLMQRCELDLEMLYPHSHRGHVSHKVEALLQEAHRRIRDGENLLIFCDLKDMPNPQNPDKPNPHGYSFHDKLRALLCQRIGLETSQVALINADATPGGASKLGVSRALEAGELRVVIGNQSMRESLDLQHGVGAILHLDVPWNAAKLTQRHGRVRRPGNPRSEVASIFFLGAAGLDAFMVDTLAGKERWGEQFRYGDCDHLESAAYESIPTRERVLALRLRDPLEREKVLSELDARKAHLEAAKARLLLLEELRATQEAGAQLTRLRSQSKLLEPKERGTPTPQEDSKMEALQARVQHGWSVLRQSAEFADLPAQLEVEHLAFEPFAGLVLYPGLVGKLTTPDRTLERARVERVDSRGRSVTFAEVDLVTVKSELKIGYARLEGVGWSALDPAELTLQALRERGLKREVRGGLARYRPPEASVQVALLAHLLEARATQALRPDGTRVSLPALENREGLLERREAAFERAQSEGPQLTLALPQHKSAARTVLEQLSKELRSQGSAPRGLLWAAQQHSLGKLLSQHGFEFEFERSSGELRLC